MAAGKAKMGLTTSLLADLLHLPVGVWISGCEFSRPHGSVVLTLEGDVPTSDGEYLTPVVTHVEDYLWDWNDGLPPARGAAPK